MNQLIADASEAFADAKEARKLSAKEQEELLDAAHEAFSQAEEASSENRASALDDLKFARLGEQWPADVMAERMRQKRPCLTINKLPAFIRQVVNDGRQNRPAMKVSPADSSGDPVTAQIINGLIRNIEYTSNADIAYDTALECAVGMGFGYWRIKTVFAHDDTFDLDLAIERIANPLTVYPDPRSTAADSADWSEAFVTEMMPLDRFKKAYKGAEATSWDASAYDDLDALWRAGDEIRLAEWWRREEVKRRIVQLSTGAVMGADDYLARQDLFMQAGIVVIGDREARAHEVVQHILSGAEVLSTTKWPGKYIPIVPVYGDEVNVEGKRVLRSLIRDAKDPQRMFNYWRTTTTELVALAPRAPWIGPKGFAKSDKGRWATANTENHPYLEYDPVPGAPPPQRQGFDGPPAGALQEALNASDDMKAIIGMYDASLGARSNETSGVAITARQREGDVSTFHFIDNLARAIRHTGRILIDLIPKVYTGPRMVRVLGQDGSQQNVPVNQQVQMPNGGAGVFDLTAGKYDLTVDTGPSFTTKRQEAAVQMTEFMRAVPQAAPLIGDLLAKNLDWPGADEIAQRLRAMLPPQLQGQDPQAQQMQQAIQQLQQQLQQAGAAVQSLQAENQRLKGDLSIKAQDVAIKGYAAETDRMQAVSAGMNPQQVQALVIQTLRQLMNSPDVSAGPPMGQPQQAQTMGLTLPTGVAQ
jgi:hypothetical protein